MATSVILLLGFGNASYAEELFSPQLAPIFATNQVHCGIVNVDDRERDVLIEVLNPGGGVLDSIEITPLDAGSSAVLAVNGNLTPNYCKFTVKGSGRNFRAGIAVFQPDVGLISALPAY